MDRDQVREQIVAKKRAEKALFISDALTQSGCDAATARRLDEQGRRAAERAAMVRQGSEATWQVVFAIMDRREQSSRDESEQYERTLLGTG